MIDHILHVDTNGKQDPLAATAAPLSPVKLNLLKAVNEAVAEDPNNPAFVDASRKITAALLMVEESNGKQPHNNAIPTLPKSVHYDPSFGTSAGQWLDTCINYTTAISPMTPGLFHESAALWMASAVVARRLVLNMPFGDIYPNIYAVWLAETTLYRKTTLMQVIRQIAREVFPAMLAPQDTTPEALLSDMSGAQPSNYDAMTAEEQQAWLKERDFAAQRAAVMDEMSALMAQTGRDYNAGLLDAYLRLYDCEPRFVRSTKGQGRIVVNNGYLSILGASTPGIMSQYLKAEHLWSNGWWPRFAILTPENRPTWRESRQLERPAEIDNVLRGLLNRLPSSKYPDPHGIISVTLGSGVYEAWNRYNKAVGFDLLQDEALDDRLHGTYGRMPTQALKVATLLAALDWSKDAQAPTIHIPHLARAIGIVEGWRASAHRALDLAAQDTSSKKRQRILSQIAKADPYGLTARDIKQSNKGYMTSAEVDAELRELMELGEIEAVSSERNPNGGRPTERYIVVRGEGRQ